jgi:hypothetical protein
LPLKPLEPRDEASWLACREPALSNKLPTAATRVGPEGFLQRRHSPPGGGSA